MERLTSQQRWIIVAVALVAAAFCLYQFIYWMAIVVNHPWLKHWLLYAVLTLIFLGIAIYCWPRGARAALTERADGMTTANAEEKGTHEN